MYIKVDESYYNKESIPVTSAIQANLNTRDKGVIGEDDEHHGEQTKEHSD